jgi:hypothetical protein
VLDGRYVRLVTDLAASPGVEELPTVFDAAVPQWVAYFDVPQARLASAKWLGFVVQDRAKFAALGLLPAERPEFPSGYANGWEFWLADQPSDYYRRHLMLHEGTHTFMQTQLGGCGPPWYMEGVAELLATHEWRDGKLRLRVFPKSRDDVPMWGRIKLVRDAVAEGRAWPIERVLAIDNSRVMGTDEYAWAWAWCASIEGRNENALRDLSKLIDRNDSRQINAQVEVARQTRGGLMAMEWQSFIGELDYGGYDFPRMKVQIADESPDVIDVDRGWQGADRRLLKGKTYRITARGRYQIAGGSEPWMCEPGGVTIEYHDGKPLGMLLGAFAGRDINDEGSFCHPIAIGLETTITMDRDGSLFLRVNDSPRQLSDNRGEITIKIDQLDE